MMCQHSSRQLKAAVAAVCPDIHAQVVSQHRPRLSDETLWRELSCCLLSSQVPYPLAQSAADEIYRAAALNGRRTPEEVRVQVQKVLSGYFRVGSSWRRYRFPVTRSQQLAKTWDAVNARAGSFTAVLASFESVNEARHWFVNHAPGIGPKQASMFLRNVGISYNVAILDRHVLEYMNAIGLHDGKARHISGLDAYRIKEAVLQDHATEIGYPVGLLDWAIWIVMRVANADNSRRLVQ